MKKPLTIDRSLATIGLATFTALAATPAQAVVMNFESLAHNGTVTYPGPIYTESGFTVSNSFNTSNPNSQAYSVWGSTSDNYTGSTGLAHTYSDTTTTLTQSNNGAFTISSIDIADYANRGLVQTINFVGNLVGGGTVNQSFTTNNTPGVQNFTFNSNFTNLASVQWTPVNGSINSVQFDNINVTGIGATAVPEPFTGLGTLVATGCAVTLKRKLAKASRDDNKTI